MNYIDEFITDLKYVKNYSDNTVSSYASDLREFQEFVRKDLTQISDVEIKKYTETFAEKSERTLARALTSMRMFYDYLIRRNIINQNPMDTIIGPKIGKYLPEVLSVEEVERLLEFTPKDNYTFRNRCILELLYSTGLRISELVSLKFENINIEDSLIKVMGKGSKERVVPIDDIATDYLKKYIYDIRPKMLKKEQNEFVFLNNHGKGLTRQAVFKMIKKRALDANIKKDISPHTLRHSFATHMLQNGADVRFIQELLGHTDVSTTEIYTHVVNERLKRDYNDLNPRDN